MCITGRFHYKGLAYLNGEQAGKLKNVTVERGDILLNITGDSVARACQVPGAIVPARVNQHVSIIRPDPEILSPDFLCYYLISPLMQKYLLSRAGSGGTRKALTKGMICDLEVPQPPENVQTRVVAILSAYDDLIENNRRRIQLLEESARLLYKEWFVHLRFPGHEHTTITDGVPEGWERKTFGQAVNNFDRLRVPVSVMERQNRQGQYPYHGAAGIIDHINGFLFDGRYLLIGEDGTVIAPTGSAMLQLVQGKFLGKQSRTCRTGRLCVH